MIPLRNAKLERKKKCWHLRYLAWNTSNCYFSQEKCLARCVLFAASVVFQRMQSSQIQHFCKCGTAFSISDELCTGCDSKSELRVIICSVSKKRPKPRELYFLYQRASCSTVCTAYLSSSLSTAPASLSEDAFCLSHTHNFRFWNFKLEENPVCWFWPG